MLIFTALPHQNRAFSSLIMLRAEMSSVCHQVSLLVKLNHQLLVAKSVAKSLSLGGETKKESKTETETETDRQKE